ncbi:hypothetical protein D1871_04140 [Nakamurella silvestris]|nr:hypothetical protein D1871_04140 [Nakamurella silvestris]
MKVDTLATLGTWLIVVAAAVGVLLAVVLKRMAAKVLGLLFFVLIAVTVFAFRDHIVSLAEENVTALCSGRVSFFGIHLQGGDARCPSG